LFGLFRKPCETLRGSVELELETLEMEPEGGCFTDEHTLLSSVMTRPIDGQFRGRNVIELLELRYAYCVYGEPCVYFHLRKSGATAA